MIATAPLQQIHTKVAKAATENLIQDPSLENTSTLVKDGAPWDNNTGTAFIETDLQHVNTGSHAIRMEDEYAYVKQTNIPVEIGANYRLTLYTKVVSGTKLNFIIHQGGVQSKTSVTNTSYEQQTYEFLATTDTITVELYTSGGSTYAWADDFELIKLAAVLDEEAPSAPTDLAAANITDVTVDLSWGASSDNVGIMGYTIYNNEVEVSAITGSAITVTLTGLTPETDYAFTVKARDGAGNYSGASNVVTVTTIPTPEAGEQPTSLVQDGGFETIPTITTTSTPWYTDEAQKNKEYSLVMSDKYTGNKSLHLAEAWCWIEQRVDVEPNSLYSVSMRVKTESTEDGVFRFGIRDAADSSRWILDNTTNSVNKSTNGWILMDNVFATSDMDTQIRLAMFQRKAGKVWIDDVIINKIEDVLVPTVPNNLISTDVSNTSVRLSWDVASDDNGIKAYEIYQDGLLLNTVSGDSTTLIVSGLERATQYSFKVRAKDVVGKYSEYSNELSVTTTDVETQYFKVEGSKILNPNGDEFVIKGANVMAYNAAWPVTALEDLQLFKTWNFNFARFYTRLDETYLTGGQPGFNRDLNTLYNIIDAYTAEGIVVMIEVHDFTGSYYTDLTTPSLTDLANFHASLAARYIDNPYVWFNVMNEPGGSGAVSTQWLTTNQRVVKAIRDTGNNSIIVADGASWGQDVGEWNASPVKEENSAILKYGNDLKSFGGNTYDNIMFSIHAYDQWSNGDAKLIDFIDRVYAKGHALMIGEFGSWNNSYNFNSLDTVMRVAPEKGVGVVAWHWYGGDRNRLTVKVEGKNGGGQDINKTDGTKPTNLTYFGNLLWDYNHNMLTEQSFNHNLEKDPDAGIVLPKPESNIIDDFENYESTETISNTWVHPGHGGAVLLELDNTNKQTGTYSMKMDYTTSSTHAGINLAVDQDWSDYDGISFWIKPDGSGRRLVVQLRIGTASWEYDYILSGTTPELVEIPFTSFIQSANMGGNPDVTKVSKLNFYINNNFRDPSIPVIERGGGILYFDDVMLTGGETPQIPITPSPTSAPIVTPQVPITPSPTSSPSVTPIPAPKVDDKFNVTIVDSANSEKIELDAELLKDAKDEKKDVVVTVVDEGDKTNYSWTFTGKNLANSDKDVEDINLSLAIKSIKDAEPLAKLLATDKDEAFAISFAHHGLLPAQATVKIYVGNQESMKPGHRVYLYYYNTETGKLDTLPYSSRYKVDQEGYITINILHCSDYIILPKKADKNTIASLRERINITTTAKTLYFGGTNENTAKVIIDLPVTLELVKSGEETSSEAVGGVVAYYRSDNPKVAEIDQEGNITPKGVGKATIITKVKLYSGKTKTVKVVINVKKPNITISNITETIQLGDFYTFQVDANGLDANEAVWSTTEKSIVVIDKVTGKAYAKSVGTDYVVVTIGNVVKKFKVIVK
jgi:chitodextrinase